MTVMKDKYRRTPKYGLVRRHLISVAESGETITYQQVAAIMDLPLSGCYMVKEISHILGEISEGEHRRGRPMLTAVVTRASGKQGPGFFALARLLKKLKSKSPGDEECCSGVLRRRGYMRRGGNAPMMGSPNNLSHLPDGQPMRPDSRKRQRAVHRASRTCKWAKTMTTWLIGRNRTTGAKWHVVDFVGPNGCESRGVVDLLAVRKNHAVHDDILKRGDMLDIVLIQVKGGSASLPTQEDIDRLRKVAKYHRARAILLCEWKRQKRLQLHLLRRNRWVPVQPKDIF